MLKLTLIITCLISCISLFGQDQEINYLKYKKEIGIDFQSIFNGSLGTSLVFKVRKPETGLIAVNEKTAYRFKITLNGNVPIGDKQIDTLGNSLINFLDTDLNRFSAGFAVGLERQINRKRLQYSYGLDLGYDYYTNKYVRYYRTTSSLSGKTVDYQNVEALTSHGPSLTPFFGFKYFILPEISVSMETGLFMNFTFNKVHETEQVIPGQEVETTQKYTYNEMNFYFDYLRALNLSYYF